MLGEHPKYYKKIDGKNTLNFISNVPNRQGYDRAGTEAEAEAEAEAEEEAEGAQAQKQKKKQKQKQKQKQKGRKPRSRRPHRKLVAIFPPPEVNGTMLQSVGITVFDVYLVDYLMPCSNACVSVDHSVFAPKRNALIPLHPVWVGECIHRSSSCC